VRRAVLLSLLTCVTALLACGVALAATVDCKPGGLCKGTPGNDKLYGTSREDTIVAQYGRDIVYGFSGGDLLKGGPDGDRMYGAAGGDTVKGGFGGDTLYGGPGADTVLAGTYDNGAPSTDDGVRDVIDCGDGTDEVYYTPGQDTIRNCEVLFTG
jgi:Ca2+-binding RTX toxin-like protein